MAGTEGCCLKLTERGVAVLASGKPWENVEDWDRMEMSASGSLRGLYGAVLMDTGAGGAVL